MRNNTSCPASPLGRKRNWIRFGTPTVTGLTWLMLPVLAGAATFICDPINGRPDGDGSPERPWRTIKEVVQGRLIALADASGQFRDTNAPVQPGDMVLLRSGWHGVIHILYGYNTKEITITAAPGHKPQVGWVSIGEGRNWRIKGLTISPSLSPEEMTRVPRNLVTLGEHGGSLSENLIIEDCFVFSTRDTGDWKANDWVTRPASGIWLGRHGKGHVARNNYILNTRFGINLCAPQCVAEGNVVENFSADGIRATRDGQVVRHNVIKNNFVSDRDGDSNHDDGIQVFLFNQGRGTIRDIDISGNIIIQRERPGLPYPNNLQGIGCFDGPLVSFQVSSNVVQVAHYHGVSLYDAQDCRILGNVCYNPEGGKLLPWVMLGQKRGLARANTVKFNLAHSFQFKSDPAPTLAENNVVTPSAYESRLHLLRAQIEARFGRIHPVAELPRIQ